MKMSKLLALALVLLISVGTLAGSTIAWFTDSVTSSGNKIESGTLKVDLELKEGNEWLSLKAEENANKAIFDYDLWEPGYTQVETLKIVNNGSLALEYKLRVVPGEDEIRNEETDQSLAEAIDVYMAFGEKEPKEFSEISEDNGWWYCGTLSEMIADEKGFTQGVMLPASEAEKLANDAWINKELNWYQVGKMVGSGTCTIAFHMKEEAGNEFQGLSLGTVSAVLEAKQYTYEYDSFDDQYDANAVYPGDADIWDGTEDIAWYNEADTTFTLSTAEELAGFAKLANEGNTFSGKTIELDSDMDLGKKQWTPIAKFAGTLDGNDHIIGNFSVDATAANGGFIDVMEWGTVQDLTLSGINATVGGYRFGVLARSINQSNIDNVTVKDVNVTTTASTAFVAGLFAHGTVNSNMEVNNCTVENLTVKAEAGASLIGGITTFVQKNGTEAEGTNIFENLNVKNFKVTVHDTDGVCGVGGLVGQTQSVWQNPRFNKCTVAGLDVTATGSVDVGGFMCYPGSYTFAEDCTVEGKIDVSGVTSAKNYAGGFFGDYGWGDNISKGDHKVTSCSADVDVITKFASAGGFVGSGTNSEGRNKNITLTNCEAKGAVTLAVDGTANIGGFAGQTDRGIYINCSAAQNPFIGKVLDGYTLNNDGNGTLTVTK